MAKAISRLYIGDKIKDINGNEFSVIATNNHYGANQVTLMQTNASISKTMGSNTGVLDYSTSNVASYLNNSYLKTLETKLANSILTTNIPCVTVDGATTTHKYINAKAFILSATELGIANNSTVEKQLSMTTVPGYLKQSAWLRGKIIIEGKNFFEMCEYYKVYKRAGASLTYNVYPVFNVPSSLLVTDSPTGTFYSFVFDVPPVIGTISNYNVNFGSPVAINYTASDDITSNLTHYISLDNGISWTTITPTKNSNNYSYVYQTGAVGTYSCRIKVVDGSNQQAISNLFTITVNASAPTINVVSVTNNVVEFKANCLTHDISKVEILINDSLVKAYSSGFNSILSYEIDKALLNLGKNSMRIKATSSENLEGYKDVEINKELYNLPPAGTKVVIGDDVYSIIYAEQSGSNQVYTLEGKLLNNVAKGQEIKITQDSVKVLCSLSNLENVKDFKEMKLVKTKKLKGQLEGYVEEKYELEGEGRYSSIKLETERFNNDVESEIIELQQYFDYMED